MAFFADDQQNNKLQPNVLTEISELSQLTSNYMIQKSGESIIAIPIEEQPLQPPCPPCQPNNHNQFTFNIASFNRNIRTQEEEKKKGCLPTITPFLTKMGSGILKLGGLLIALI